MWRIFRTPMSHIRNKIYVYLIDKTNFPDFTSNRQKNIKKKQQKNMTNCEIFENGIISNKIEIRICCYIKFLLLKVCINYCRKTRNIVKNLKQSFV